MKGTLKRGKDDEDIEGGGRVKGTSKRGRMTRTSRKGAG